ncbi:hypothetical protein BFJ69_g16951 [Fusarium oxysporum]|uniref:Fungal STAND N-terminal Goodbye domain-containing protein n=1 Tax=Fusarium oxysporum TaxID=5507 RepID=A0A420M9Q0_FUSOX|nr:hypothetical protein BFJ69_g16951 [Fusarium oxysporum]
MPMDRQQYPRLHGLAVEFVEKRGPQYHKAFNSSNAVFDPVADAQAISNALLEPPPRQLPPRLVSMTFWNLVFPKAMERLQQCPAIHKNDKYHIRNSTNWSEVQTTLLSAKDAYDGRNHEGRIGRATGKVKEMRRIIMDKSAVPLQQAAKFVPDIEIASPIVGSVKVLLEAYRTAAKLREDVSNGFENLCDTFADIDFITTRFANDKNIIQAAESLVFAILKATEYAIGFYTSHQVVRALKATTMGELYQHRLVDSLKEISDCKASLDNEGKKSESYFNQSSQQRDAIFGIMTLDSVNQLYRMLDQLSEVGIFRTGNVVT